MEDDPLLTIAGDAGLVAGAIAIALLIHGLLFRFLSRSSGLLEKSTARNARLPAGLLLVLLAALLVLPGLRLSADAGEVVRRILSLAVIACAGLSVAAMLGVAEDLISARHPTSVRDNLESRALQTRIKVFRTIGVAVIGVITASAMLMTFPSVRQLGVSLLASAGLVGLVAGMAARPALANFIAGVQLAITQPIRIDDVVIVEGEWGRIEEITASFVVVRIWDRRTLVVPLVYFVEHPVENWTRTGSELLATAYIYTDYTVSVPDVREELKRILDASPLWDKRAWTLQVTGATERALELRCLMSARDAGEAFELRCEVREKLIDYLQHKAPDALPRDRAEIAVAADGRSPAS